MIQLSDFFSVGSGGLEWEIVSTDITAEANKGYFVDTSAGIVNITLPLVAEIGDVIEIVDDKVKFGIYACQILRNGHKIAGLERDRILDINDYGIRLIYRGDISGWMVMENKKDILSGDALLWLWGYNNNGQLGNDSRLNRSGPVQTISGGNNWKQVACGGWHTASVKYTEQN